MADCLFCDIATGRIPCDEVYADADFLAFRDINPQAPTHVLIIPRRHIGSLAELTGEDSELMGKFTIVAAKLAAELGLAPNGYRWVINCGPDAFQTVPHLHLHLLGGRKLGWPPG
ncbi:MAG: histidine triad nucleotide-binding protein [bacterium]